MNIEMAKDIPLSSILDKIGAKSTKQEGAELWYLSPFRKERTASFHINTAKNIWYDFGESKGGGVIEFVCYYLHECGEDHTVADALRWLGNMQPHQIILPMAAPKQSDEKRKPALSLRKVAALRNPKLADYVESRGIPASLACKYLKEVTVYNKKTDKEFHALGLCNEEGGYELRNKYFKGCVAPKAITFIRGSSDGRSNGIHVFEGSMDFLTALIYQQNNAFMDDVIVLNSVSCLSQAIAYIKNYGYSVLFSWLDNNDAGERAARGLQEFAASEPLLAFKLMNKLYAGHVDVNAWHMHKLRLPALPKSVEYFHPSGTKMSP